jgi:[acyl-carrier-protein] S-malonyltransferase
MADTRALQPALTVAALTLWMHAAGRTAAHCFGGHSLGEYPALAAAGVLAVEEALELVSLRGALMAEAGGPTRA